MPGAGTIFIVAIAYLGLLFAIAFYIDSRPDKGGPLIANPYVYSLSLAVYATSWTFYGSVGKAAESGVGFLPIYLGPTLGATVSWLVVRKMVRICKTHRITSIADFIAWRYGKSGALAGLVTIVAAVGLLPYIALQLKAVALSFSVLLGMDGSKSDHVSQPGVFDDRTLYVALFLAAFSILFGTRQLDVTERHPGLVAAVAFESIVKLLAFLAVGCFVTFGLFDGFGAIFEQAQRTPELMTLFTLGDSVGGFSGWISLITVSMLAILCLPRQFQIAVVENADERHLRVASWLFPLYMLAINIFVLPIALGGQLRLPINFNADAYVLTLPMLEGQRALAMFAFLGGLSAATGMVIVETLALSMMICNDLVMPALLRRRTLKLDGQKDLSGLLLGIRRGAIVGIVLLGYAYHRAAGEMHSLVTLGLVSFCAVAQFAPAMLGGMYWRQGTAYGAVTGLSLGAFVWLYTMLLPSFADSGWISPTFITDGPWGVRLLRPRHLFGLDADWLTNGLFWTLFTNVSAYGLVSLLGPQRLQERAHALMFVDAFKTNGDAAKLWRGAASIADLRGLTKRFMGRRRTSEAFLAYARSRGVSSVLNVPADEHAIHFVERLLSGIIGTASARVVVSNVVREEPLELKEVLGILDEASQVKAYSRTLEEKSRELERTSSELEAAIQRLQVVDRQKDDFLSIVTHELRTPVASIRALSEVLADNPSIDAGRRVHFLRVIGKESERLTRLINQVLDLANVKANRMVFNMSNVEVSDLLHEVVDASSHSFARQSIELTLIPPPFLVFVVVDRDRMLQVLLNLLSNASKFCSARQGKVTVAAHAATDVVRIDVMDNGSGVPIEDRELIFERFVQLFDTDSGKPEGTGLGLAICQQIVHRFGGRIWVDASPDGGSCFSFTIPRVRDAG